MRIPLLSRIVSVADCYDAIAAVRPYHRPRPHAEIMRILYEGQARKYDPAVLATFAAIIEQSAYKASAEVPPLEPSPPAAPAARP